MEKIYYGNTNQKQSRVATLIADKVYFRARNSARDKGGHFIIIKEPVHLEDITILNDYVLNKIYEAKTDRTVRRNRQMHNYCWRFQILLSQ